MARSFMRAGIGVLMMSMFAARFSDGSWVDTLARDEFQSAVFGNVQHDAGRYQSSQREER